MISSGIEPAIFRLVAKSQPTAPPRTLFHFISHFTRPQRSYRIKDDDVGGVYVVSKRELKNEYHFSVGISKEK
jgi:hypothetical protein